jgi:hypothetical protein
LQSTYKFLNIEEKIKNSKMIITKLENAKLRLELMLVNTTLDQMEYEQLAKQVIELDDSNSECIADDIDTIMPQAYKTPISVQVDALPPTSNPSSE